MIKLRFPSRTVFLPLAGLAVAAGAAAITVVGVVQGGLSTGNAWIGFLIGGFAFVIGASIRLEVRRDVVVVGNAWPIPRVVRLEEVSGVERRPGFFFGGAVLTLKDGGSIGCPAASGVSRRWLDRINAEIADPPG
jgi:hypothetical protein